MEFRNRLLAAFFPKGYAMLLQQNELQKNIDNLKAKESSLQLKISEKQKQLELIEFKRNNKPKFKVGVQIRDMKILSMKPIYRSVLSAMVSHQEFANELGQAIFSPTKLKIVLDRFKHLSGWAWEYEVDIRGVVKCFTEPEFIQVVTDGPEPINRNRNWRLKT